MIHGGGSDSNTANRWFDKTMQVMVIHIHFSNPNKWPFVTIPNRLQIIICNDGAWGLCYEHSTSEGIAPVLLLEKILDDINHAVILDDSVSHQHLPPPERLEWMITPEISQRMYLATKNVDRRIADLDFFVYRYQGYGKTFIKSCKVSPDVYIQLALQLAYYKWVPNMEIERNLTNCSFALIFFRLYGHFVTTYESASTRRFLLVNCIFAVAWDVQRSNNMDSFKIVSRVASIAFGRPAQKH